jgi:hypothetical protein
MNETRQILRDFLSRGDSIEDALCKLRGAGASFLEGIKAVRDECDIDVGSAKELLLRSAWADQLNARKQSEEQLFAAIKDIDGVELRNAD